MVPVIHALGLLVFSKLSEGFLVSQLQERLPSGTTAMQSDLMQCAAKPTSGYDGEYKDSTSLVDPGEACSEWNSSWKTAV